MNINSFNLLLTVVNKFFIVSNKIDKHMKLMQNKQPSEVTNQTKRKRINKRTTKIKDF